MTNQTMPSDIHKQKFLKGFFFFSPILITWLFSCIISWFYAMYHMVNWKITGTVYSFDVPIFKIFMVMLPIVIVLFALYHLLKRRAKNRRHA